MASHIRLKPINFFKLVIPLSIIVLVQYMQYNEIIAFWDVISYNIRDYIVDIRRVLYEGANEYRYG